MEWKVKYGVIFLAGSSVGNGAGRYGTRMHHVMKKVERGQYSTKKYHLLFMNMKEPEAYIEVNANSSP